MRSKQKSVKVFYCYARKNKAQRDELDKHLAPLKRLGYITSWYDREILPGTMRESQIKQQLTSSSIILLLISADFIASDYCYSVEMQKALELHRSGQAYVIPVILRPVNWLSIPSLAQLQALPSNGQPIASPSWHNRDEAYKEVAEGISKVIKTFALKDAENLKESELLSIDPPMLEEGDIIAQTDSNAQPQTTPMLHISQELAISEDELTGIEAKNLLKGNVDVQQKVKRGKGKIVGIKIDTIG